jgi:hypothetical protein
MQALTSLASSTAKSAKAWSDSTTVWTTTWPLWPLQSTDARAIAMAAGYEPPLLWLRHDRTPLKGEVRVMLNGAVLYHSLRTGAREASADTPLVMVSGCGRRLTKEGTEGLLETIELRELPGFPGHVVTVQILGAASSDTATGGAKNTGDRVLGMRATALRSVRYALTLDGEPVDADTASPDYLRKYSRFVARTGQWHQLCFGGQAHKLVSISRTRKDPASRSVQYSLDVGDTIAREETTRWYRYSEFAQLHTDVCTCFRSSEWAKLPALPPKTWTTGSSSQTAAVVDGRRKALEDWLRALLMTPRGPRNPYLLEFLGAFEGETWERYRAAAWPELCTQPEPEPEPEQQPAASDAEAEAEAAAGLDLDALMGDIAGELGDGDMHFAVTGEKTPSSSSRPQAAAAAAALAASQQTRAAAAAKAAAAATGVAPRSSAAAIAEGVPPEGSATTPADAARARAARSSVSARAGEERDALAAAARARASVSTAAGGAEEDDAEEEEEDSDDDAL